MAEFDFRLRLFDPDGTRGRVLQTLTQDVTLVESAAGQVSFTLSSKVAGTLQSPLVVGVEYFNGVSWNTPRNNLFLMTEDDGDNASPAGVVSYRGMSYVPWLLSRALLFWTSAAKDGERTWTDRPGAQPVYAMVAEAKGRGWGPWVTVDFNTVTDSNGAAWTTADEATQSFPLMIDAWKVLEQGASQGLFEWWTEGTLLRCFRVGTGVDRSSTVGLGGRGYTRQPVKSSFDDVFTNLVVVGDKLKSGVYLTNTGATTEFGRLEASMTQSGVKSPTVATKLAQPALLDGRSVKREWAFEFTPGGDRRYPFAHFNIGDLVTARTRNGKGTQRIVGIVLTKSTDGVVTCRVAVGSKIRTLNSKLVRRSGAASVGKVNPGGSGQLVPSVTPPPSPVPAAPTGVTIVSNVGAFADDGSARSTVLVEWDAVTTADDGSEIDLPEYEVWHRPVGGVAHRVTAVGDIQVSLTMDSGDERLVKVRAGVAGRWGEFSSEVSVTPAYPSAVPAAPTSPILLSKLKTITVVWDGALTSGAPAAGFAHVFAEASLTGSSGWVPVGSAFAAGGVTFTAAEFGADIGDTVWVRLTAVNTIGGVSSVSSSTTVVVAGIQAPDLEADSVTANAIEAGAIKAQHLNVGVGDTGQRLELTGDGFRVYDEDGTLVLSIGTTDDDRLAVSQKNPDGELVTVAYIDENGDAGLQNIELSGDMTVQGAPLIGTFASDTTNGRDLGDVPLLDRVGRGIVAVGKINTGGSYTAVTHTYAALGIGSVNLLSNRRYRVRITGPTFAEWTSGSAAGWLYLQLYVGTGAQSVSSPNSTDGAASQTIALTTGAANGVENLFDGFTFQEFTPAVSGDFNVLLRLNNTAGRGWTFAPTTITANPVRMVVEDVGPSVIDVDTEDWSSRATSGSVTPPAATRTQTWSATWSVLWGPSGSIRPSGSSLYDDGRMLQGGNTSIGNGRAGQVGFPALGLSGKTIKGAWLRVKVRHTGTSTGATIDIGTHGNSAAPSGSSPSNVNTFTKKVTKGQDLWIPIPSSQWAGIASGAIRGFQIGGPNVNSGASDYAILDGYSTTNAATSSGVRPQLKITYI